jgi:hypothetical protein
LYIINFPRFFTSKSYLQLFCFAFVFLGFGYFFFGGIGGMQYGPRYYFEGFVLSSVFMFTIFLGDFHILRKGNYNNILKLLLTAAIIHNLLNIPYVAYFEHKVIRARKEVYDLIERHNVTSGIILLKSSSGSDRPMGPKNLARNFFQVDRPVLYLHYDSPVEEQLELLGRYYPSRNIYVYERIEDAGEGMLIKIK